MTSHSCTGKTELGCKAMIIAIMKSLFLINQHRNGELCACEEWRFLFNSASTSLFKHQRSRIDTKSQARWSRPIFEHMPQMGIAGCTNDFRPNHAVRRINTFFNRASHLLIEAGPATAGVKFGIRYKQRLTTTSTAINTKLHCLVVLTGKWPFSSSLSGNEVGMRIQQCLPLFRRAFHSSSNTLPSGYSLFTLLVTHSLISPCYIHSRTSCQIFLGDIFACTHD